MTQAAAEYACFGPPGGLGLGSKAAPTATALVGDNSDDLPWGAGGGPSSHDPWDVEDDEGEEGEGAVDEGAGGGVAVTETQRRRLFAAYWDRRAGERPRATARS